LRCGAPQPPRVVRGVFAGLAFCVAVIVTVIAFRSLEGGAPEYRVPSPSAGSWQGEEEFGAQDVRDHGPSLFTAILDPDAGI
jgi:hypothetical protein